MRTANLHRLGAVVALLAAAAAASGCGYALAGRGGSLPEHIRVIGIPQFTNQSTWPDIDKIVTDRVSDEFRGRGKYRVLQESVRRRRRADRDGGERGGDADVVYERQPAGIELRDGGHAQRRVQGRQERQGHLVQPVDDRPRRVRACRPDTGSDPAAFFRQDANSVERLARSLAKTLTTSIFEAM